MDDTINKLIHTDSFIICNLCYFPKAQLGLFYQPFQIHINKRLELMIHVLKSLLIIVFIPFYFYLTFTLKGIT